MWLLFISAILSRRTTPSSSTRRLSRASFPVVATRFRDENMMESECEPLLTVQPGHGIQDLFNVDRREAVRRSAGRRCCDQALAMGCILASALNLGPTELLVDKEDGTPVGCGLIFCRIVNQILNVCGLLVAALTCFLLFWVPLENRLGLCFDCPKSPWSYGSSGSWTSL